MLFPPMRVRSERKIWKSDKLRKWVAGVAFMGVGVGEVGSVGPE